eukprot:Phypoly_transcript_02512.p1 GENE.Phypoly_transcript_02512~~Phypoly_transcript_02512.p1  ORF type:complete len:910 (+),score=55.06 Phypoly_transcript_02512:331-2730(+)
MTWTCVSLGVYDLSYLNVTSGGASMNVVDPTYLAAPGHNYSVYFPEDEWITNISTCVIPFETYHEIGGIYIGTNKRAISMPGNITGSCTGSTYSYTLTNTQIIIGFSATYGSVFDQVNITLMNCTKDCPTGPYGSGKCALRDYTCPNGSYCQDTSVWYQCTCYDGLEMVDGQCVPISQPCSNSACDPSVNCTPSAGPYGFSCSACPGGFTGSGYTQCQDIDECAGPNDCSSLATCINIDGSYECLCNSGYTGDGSRCSDINECSSSNNCSSHATCNNTMGSYECHCKNGYYGNGLTCDDIDECVAVNDTCSSDATCTNTMGSYECTCKSGYSGNGYNCTAESADCVRANCGSFATCVNVSGSYQCICNDGFSRDGLYCTDIDECNTGTANCSKFSNCLNWIGNYSCECYKGYEGDGYFCAPICGNGTCDSQIGENCLTCYSDCKTASCKVCGDGYCDINSENCQSCPNDCGVCSPKICGGSPQCSGHGTCYNGLCNCNDYWTGPLCNDTTAKIGVSVQNGASISNDLLTFKFSFTKLLEYDAQKLVIQELDLTSNSFTFQKNTTAALSGQQNYTQWYYNLSLQNGAFVNLTIWQFDDLTHYPFANTVLHFPPNTVKLTFSIHLWPFLDATHSLGIEMKTTGNNSSSPVTKTNLDNNPDAGSVRWITMSYGDTTLYGKFLDLAIVDGRARNITYVHSSDTVVTAVVPHFWEYAVVDPDLSVLVASRDSSNSVGTKSKTGLNKTLLIEILVPVAAVFLLVILIAILWSKISRVIAVKRHRTDSTAELANLKSVSSPEVTRL